jgi:hypothetical protein
MGVLSVRVTGRVTSGQMHNIKKHSNPIRILGFTRLPVWPPAAVVPRTWTFLGRTGFMLLCCLDECRVGQVGDTNILYVPQEPKVDGLKYFKRSKDEST